MTKNVKKTFRSKISDLLRLYEQLIKACFIRRILVASNAIQTIDNEA